MSPETSRIRLLWTFRRCYIIVYYSALWYLMVDYSNFNSRLSYKIVGQTQSSQLRTHRQDSHALARENPSFRRGNILQSAAIPLKSWVHVTHVLRSVPGTWNTVYELLRSLPQTILFEMVTILMSAPLATAMYHGLGFRV